MDELSKNIDRFTDTNIRDRKTIEFINDIKSLRLKSIVRNYFEYKCGMIDSWYSVEKFKEEFIKYLNDKIIFCKLSICCFLLKVLPSE